MAWYWLKNAGDGSHFSKKDVVFECFHNFVALSQRGNTIFESCRASEDEAILPSIVSEDHEWKF